MPAVEPVTRALLPDKSIFIVTLLGRWPMVAI
jgi:hypothetical protein